eukprot:1967247-Amphidinium_carterae.1
MTNSLGTHLVHMAWSKEEVESVAPFPNESRWNGVIGPIRPLKKETEQEHRYDKSQGGQSRRRDHTPRRNPE